MNEIVISSTIFITTVLLIVFRIVDEPVAGLLGGILMVVLLKSYTPSDAFNFISWDVMGILLGMWIIAGYLMESGVIDRTVGFLEKKIRSYRMLVLSLSTLAGLLSTFLDNVLVILLLGGVVLEASRRYGKDPIPSLMLVTFSANFMGTALLLGDIPPQLLHAVAGYEFLDFIVFRGRPSSFPLLTATFIAVTLLYTKLFIEKGEIEKRATGSLKKEYNRTLALITITVFMLTVVAMALRPMLGVPLGFISLSGASLLSFTVELYRRFSRSPNAIPSFEKICVERVEWRAILFYLSLFVVTGGLEHSGALQRAASLIEKVATFNVTSASTLFYWFSALLSTVVEHDTIVLVMLYVAKEFALKAGMEVWPLYWSIAWGATLASNLTAAAAPAIYVAFSLAEREGFRIAPRNFFKFSTFFVVTSLVIQYVISHILFLR